MLAIHSDFAFFARSSVNPIRAWAIADNVGFPVAGGTGVGRERGSGRHHVLFRQGFLCSCPQPAVIPMTATAASSVLHAVISLGLRFICLFLSFGLFWFE